MSVIVRGSRVYFSFTFYDEDGEEADCTSATLQLTYPAACGFETETLTLTESGSNWLVEWDSSKSKGGWVHYHAHALAGSSAEFAKDGRFRLKANRANYDHDALPNTGTPSDYQH